MNDLLSDLRIVDLSMGWAGPLAARHLADMGAEVIKVEGCSRFDWWRSWEATQEWIDDNGAEKALPYLYANRNKLDITLDLETKQGRELLLQLISQSDGLIENFSGGTLPKLGLTYQEIRKANEQIVMLSMPAFGSDGPWAEFRAYGSTIEQSSGLPHLNGRPEDPPTMQHVALGDSIAGLNGAAAMLTALTHKQRTGEGQFISSVLFWLDVQLESSLSSSCRRSIRSSKSLKSSLETPLRLLQSDSSNICIRIQLSSPEHG